MISPRVVIRTIVLTPIRVARDIFDWIVKVLLPNVAYVLTTTPVNIVFILGLIALLTMYFFSGIWVQILVIYWESGRVILNIQLLAINLIIGLLYDWLAGFWNEGVLFTELVIKIVWDSTCGGAQGFGGYADCTGFSNLLIMGSFFFQAIGQIFTVFFNLCTLIFTLLSASVCQDVNCSNICDTGACSTWREFDSPGPFGVKFSITQEESDSILFAAQVVAKIIVAAIQWIVGDVLPFLAQIFAFACDVVVLLTIYLSQIIGWIIWGISLIFGNLSFIFIRAYISVLSSSTNHTLSIDPQYYQTNRTAYSNEKMSQIQNNYVGQMIGNHSVLFLEDENLPGSKETTLLLIQIYWYINQILVFTFQTPDIALHLIDKGLCFVWYLPGCLKIGAVCDVLFKPPMLCVLVAEMTFDGLHYHYKNDFAFAINVLRTVAYSPMGQYFPFPENGATGNINGYSLCIDPYTNANIGQQTWCPDPNDQMTVPNIGAGCKQFNSDFPGYQSQLGCIKTDGTLNDPAICKSITNLGGSDPPSPSNDYCLTNFGQLDLTRFADATDIYALPPGVDGYCVSNADTYVNRTRGFLYQSIPAGVLEYTGTPDPGIWWDGFQSIFGLFIYEYSFMHAIAYFFFDTCHLLLGSECPCMYCQADPSQALSVLDFIPGYEGWPCNAAHPTQPCCELSPWKSLYYYWDAFMEWLGIDSFNQTSIIKY